MKFEKASFERPKREREKAILEMERQRESERGKSWRN